MVKLILNRWSKGSRASVRDRDFGGRNKKRRGCTRYKYLPTHTHTHSSFGRMTRRLSDDVVPRGEQGIRDGNGNEYGNEHEGRNGGRERERERGRDLKRGWRERALEPAKW